MSRTDPSICSKCGSSRIVQDEDVLDTWFSSQLWPFSTLGWPETTEDFKTFYPNSLLVTGFDIIFFWVARMMMAGLKFAADVPFREVYITGLVRDIERKKLSKSMGNAGDPMLVCDQYGTDAVRFTLARLGAPGSDLVLTEDQLDGYRAFSTKIWNAARFIFSTGHATESLLSEDEIREAGANSFSLADCWILSRQMRVVGEVNEALERYFLHEAARSVYQFFWHEFCDWYLEMVKLHPERSRPVLIHVFEKALRTLHPFMPFITEELWQQLPHHGESIMVAPYPTVQEELISPTAERKIALIQEIIIKVRNIRSEINVSAKRRVPLRVATGDAAVRDVLVENEDYMRRLARVDRLEVVSKLTGERSAARAVAGGLSLEIPLADVIDFGVEQDRLRRELQKIRHEIDALEKKLANRKFIEKAPETVVEENRKRLAEYQVKEAGLIEGLERLR